nr:hypothetical protein [Gammaproteobacteria bacterium]
MASLTRYLIMRRHLKRFSGEAHPGRAAPHRAGGAGCEAQPHKPLVLCGEQVRRTTHLPWLLQIDIRTLSVAPWRVPLVKEALRSIDHCTDRPSQG